MLRTDLVPSRPLRTNRPRAIRRRDNPALLFLGPATPAANASPDFNTPKRPRIVKYIVDHICEPISPNRSTSDELSAPPQGAVKTPLSIQLGPAAVQIPSHSHGMQNFSVTAPGFD